MAKKMKRHRPEPESSGTLNLYCAEDAILLRGDGSDPFQYWQTKKVLWPKLAKMATKYLSIRIHQVQFTLNGCSEQLTQLKVNRGLGN